MAPSTAPFQWSSLSESLNSFKFLGEITGWAQPVPEILQVSRPWPEGQDHRAQMGHQGHLQDQDLPEQRRPVYVLQPKQLHSLDFLAENKGTFHPQSLHLLGAACSLLMFFLSPSLHPSEFFVCLF